MNLRLHVLAFALALAFVSGCSASSQNALCTCEVGQKFDGETCLAEADFVAPTCEASTDDVAVCGCDGANYTSSCAAYTAGTEVQYGGACRAGAGGGGGGNDNGGFGW